MFDVSPRPLMENVMNFVHLFADPSLNKNCYGSAQIRFFEMLENLRCFFGNVINREGNMGGPISSIYNYCVPNIPNNGPLQSEQME